MILRCSSLATITVALLFSQITLTYSQSPHLSGHAEISLAHGFLKCDFKLSGVPRITDYFIRLNAGFNISHILDSANQKTFRLSRDEATAGQAFEYYLPHKDGTKALPSTLLF